jgi:EAL domain-containing protein (putative c-di-GMP-specific phosphodiesterase class I)/GGDEF domain-containing protein
MKFLSRLLFIEMVRQISQDIDRSRSLLYIEINHTLQIASLLQGTEAEEGLLASIRTMILTKVKRLPNAYMGQLDHNRFGVVLDLPVKEGVEFAEKLAGFLDQQCITVFELPYYPKLIIGVTAISPAYKTPERMLAAVDEALYQARRAGNSVVKLIEPDDPFLHEYYNLLKLLPELREGLSNNSFILYAQPIVPMNHSATTAKAEVLLRYRTGDGDIDSQNRFLQAAELFHMSREVDLYVVHHFARYIHQQKRQDIVYSLNISGSTIRYPGFLDTVYDEFRHFGVDSRKVCFEITENVADQDYRQAVLFMNSLKNRLGCQLSLDDIGIGSSNLSNLSKFDVDFFKIDGSFIHNLSDDPYCELVVDFITEAASLFNRETIAEYVENAEQLEKLKSLGVDYAQGYFTGKPELLFDPSE